MTRLLAYSLILFGIYFFAKAGYDENRGVASAYPPGGGSALGIPVKRDENPRDFRSLMTYKWIRAPLFLCAGLLLLGFCHRADRLDPFSPDFATNAKNDALDKTPTDEKEK